MAGESTLERENLREREVQQNRSLAVFRIVDGIKDILEDDRKQKQPLFLSINEKLLIKTVKDYIENKRQQCLIGITGESASGKTTLVNYVSKALRKKLFNETYTSLCCDDYYNSLFL